MVRAGRVKKDLDLISAYSYYNNCEKVIASFCDDQMGLLLVVESVFYISFSLGCS